MDAKSLLDLIIPLLGKEESDVVKKQLEEIISGSDSAWKKSILNLVGESIKKFGVGGIYIAIDAVKDILNGETVEIDWADLGTASDVLAHLQNAEAGRKSAVRTFLTQVGEVLGIILSALIKGLIT